MQLNNIKARIKVEEYGDSQSNLSDIIDWCKLKDVPQDLDQVFCGGRGAIII